MAGVSTGVSLLTCSASLGVVVVGAPFSTSCPLNGGFSCDADIAINFTILGNSRTPTDVDMISVVGGGFRLSYTANANGGSLTVRIQEVDTTPRVNTIRIRVRFGSGSDYIESVNFNINHQGTTGVITPTLNWGGPSTGVCEYSSPDTSCVANTSSNYNVSNYIDGTVTAEYVSGDSGIIPTKSGSNSSGNFAWSKLVSSTVSAVYRLKLTASSGTVYSANRTITLSGSAYVNPVAAGLMLWFDFPTSSTYVNAVNNLQQLPGVGGMQNSSSPVSGALGSYHREIFSQSAGVDTRRSFNWTTNPITITGDCSIAYWSNDAYGVYSGSYPNGYQILDFDPFQVIYDGAYHRIYNGSTVLASITSSGNTWEFISFTVKRTGSSVDVRGYRNGVLVVTNLSQPSTVATGKVYGGLGTYNVIAQSAVASKEVDSLGLWAKELTAGEVSSLYNSGTGVTYSFF